jgi:hypothetical protein
MRKFLMILVFGFLLSFNVKAENIVVEELFGVKILDNISKHANKTDGIEQDHL